MTHDHLSSEAMQNIMHQHKLDHWKVDLRCHQAGRDEGA
jgi:hypothetical protein